MSKPLILSIDQGTTSSRALVFDLDLNVVAVAQQEFTQHFPHDGWVEHDAEEIWETTLAVVRQAVGQAEAGGGRVAAVGVVNQRETTVVWERDSGRPLHRAIVWQDRRTADRCRHLVEAGHEPEVQRRTGLLLDPYFSATKVAWILDHVDGARAAAQRGELAFGTIDSFLIWRLTGGAVHATDATNASRTSLYDLQSGDWSPELLELFQVPASLLPEVRDCAAEYGETARGLLDRQLPICGVAGDQQAALIGQGCFAAGEVKSTYGTGCFVLMNTGELAPRSENRLLTTVAYQLDGQRHFAIEGSIFVAGSGVQWLRDGLGLVEHAADTQALAESLDDNSGVYIVPAFTGLGAPHWRPDARGLICGLSRGTGRAHLARAMLEAVAYQTHDLMEAFAADSVAPDVLKVDGGMAANDWLMQFLSDLLQRPVLRPACTETTALGAAYLAGLQQGLLPGPAEFAAQWRANRRFEPADNPKARAGQLAGWRDAVGRTIGDRG